MARLPATSSDQTKSRSLTLVGWPERGILSRESCPNDMHGLRARPGLQAMAEGQNVAAAQHNRAKHGSDWPCQHERAEMCSAWPRDSIGGPADGLWLVDAARVFNDAKAGSCSKPVHSTYGSAQAMPQPIHDLQPLWEHYCLEPRMVVKPAVGGYSRIKMKSVISGHV